jgi:CheY-like chemotaxis protein
MLDSPSQKTRVLVVDDRPETTKILSRLLEVSGFEPHVATSGAEALDMYSTIQPHTVLLDLGMPDIDGFEVCWRIRQMPEAAGVLIVVVSGYDQEEQKVRATAVGANHYFVKPVEPTKLLTLIEQHAANE